MLIVELVERKVGEVDTRIIPLENLSGEDLDRFKELSGGMVDELYVAGNHTHRIRKSDAYLIDIDTVRIMLIKECVLLWTVVTANLKKHPHCDQLLAWLSESPHTRKGELMLIEREVHVETSPSEGPECLFGENLEVAMTEAPSGGSFEQIVEE